MDYQDQEEYGYDQPQASGSATGGLKIAIIILLIVLAAVSVLYWQSVRRDAAEVAAMEVDMDTITAQYSRLMGEMDGMKFDNDTLNVNLEAQRHKADSLMTKLKRERSINYSKIKRYERELGTLRSTLQGFVRTIDSLNQLNHRLVGENVKFRKEISTLRTTTEAARETASELNNKIKRGSVIRARDITLRAVNRRDKDVTKARQADRLITTLVLAANDLAVPGERTVYVRIISPDGYDLSENQNSLFEFEGSRIPYSASRKVDYQCDDLSVSVYYNGTGLTAGQYTVMVYMDGHLIGSNVIILK
ncbi:MAG: hypothetical protein RR980_04415 [Mucinivorans sp.]